MELCDDCNDCDDTGTSDRSLVVDPLVACLRSSSASSSASSSSPSDEELPKLSDPEIAQLLQAARDGRVDRVKALLARGGHPDDIAAGGNGETSLYITAQLGRANY